MTGQMSPAGVPADLMRAAESAVHEAFKDDHREPSAVWTVVIYYALAAVLPLHEQQVRAAVADELEALRVQLGESRLEWGVRIFDRDPASATEVMSGKDMALEVAACWREEIEDSNPTLMQRTMRDEGQWREAADDAAAT